MSTTKKQTARAKGSKPTWKTPRKCKFCKATFTPKRPQEGKATFCEADHRKLFHKYGALPFTKLRDDLRNEVKREVAAQLAPHIEAMRGDLADLLRVTLGERKATA